MNPYTFTQYEHNEVISLLNEINSKLSHSKKLNEMVFDNADALKILKVSRRTLLEWRTKRLISFSQVGSKIYYTQQDFDEFIKRHYYPNNNLSPKRYIENPDEKK